MTEFWSSGGKLMKRIMLHGGGCSAYGVYHGLFESLGVGLDDFVKTELVTASAGSMYLMKMLHDFVAGETDASSEKIERMHKNLFESVSIWEALEDQNGFLCSQKKLQEELSQIMDEHEKVRNITFKSLHDRLPNLKLVVLATGVRDGTWYLKRFSADETPHVRVFDACLASMSVPILFESVTIDGELFCDADCMTKNEYADESTWHINCRQHEIRDVLSKLSVNIPLIDTIVQFVANLWKLTVTKTPERMTIQHEFQSSVLQSPMKEEYIQCGKTLAGRFMVKKA